MVGFAGARTIKNTIPPGVAPGLPDQRVPAQARLRRPHRRAQGLADRGGAGDRLLPDSVDPGVNPKPTPTRGRGMGLPGPRLPKFFTTRCAVGFLGNLFGGKKTGKQAQRQGRVAPEALGLAGPHRPGEHVARLQGLRPRDGPHHLPETHGQDQDRRVRAAVQDAGPRQALRGRNLRPVQAQELRHHLRARRHQRGRAVPGHGVDRRAWPQLPDRNAQRPAAQSPRELPRATRRRRTVPARLAVPAPRPLPAQRNGRQERRGQADRLRADRAVHPRVLPAGQPHRHHRVHGPRDRPPRHHRPARRRVRPRRDRVRGVHRHPTLGALRVERGDLAQAAQRRPAPCQGREPRTLGPDGGGADQVDRPRPPEAVRHRRRVQGGDFGHPRGEGRTADKRADLDEYGE